MNAAIGLLLICTVSASLSLSFPRFATISFTKDAFKYFYEAAHALCRPHFNYNELKQSLEDFESRACRSFASTQALFIKCRNLLKNIFVDGHLLESYVTINKALSKLPLHKPIHFQNEFMLLDHIWNMRRLVFSQRYLLHGRTTEALTVAYLVPKMFDFYVRMLKDVPHPSFNPTALSIFLQEFYMETVKERMCIVYRLLQESFLQPNTPQETDNVASPKTINITLDLLVLQRTFPEIVRSHFAGKAVQAEHQIALLYEAIGDERFRKSLFAKITNINLDDGHRVALYYALLCHRQLETKLEKVHFKFDKLENIETITIPYLITIHKKIIKLTQMDVCSAYKKYIQALKICCVLTGDYTVIQ